MRTHALALILASTLCSTSYALAIDHDSLIKREPLNTCGDSLFVDQTSNGSPLIGDCLAIADQLSNQFYVSTRPLPNTDKDPIRTRVFGSCVFGLRKAFEGPQFQRSDVGAQDAIDLIRDSVRRFASNGKVGASGAMVCSGDPPGGGVWWGIFHS